MSSFLAQTLYFLFRVLHTRTGPLVQRSIPAHSLTSLLPLSTTTEPLISIQHHLAAF